MNNKAQQALLHAAALTFEELGFMLPEIEIDESRRNAVLEAAVSLDFRGPFNGTLVLRLHGNLLPGLAANMLGESEPPARKLQCDALGEIANVICGNMLPEIAGARAVFQLSAPLVVTRDEHKAMFPVHNPAATVSIGIENGRADLFLIVNDNPTGR